MDIPGDPSTPPATIFRVGDLVGDTYEIRGVLGEGAMGQVFDAYDTNLSRRVAIKANFPGVGYTVKNEAQALAAVRHPGVVGVYAFGRQGGVEYMVMEHVSGVTLADHLERLEGAGLPLHERLDLLTAVADGLAAIHRAGIAHGDVKLDNVLLSASGRVLLTDLGLVRAAYEPSSGRLAGTPTYMAPEIVTSKYPNAGWHLVDVYAFGIMCYRMLAGVFPFDAPSHVDVLLMQADEPVPKLPDDRQVPKRLSELVTQLLSKDPTDRPETMDAVVWQLRRISEQLAESSGQQGKAPTAPPEASLRVLVVDDDPDIARLVGMYVKQASPRAEVAIANDSQEALEAFRARPPRLVFLDLMMPKTSGFELFTYLRGVHLVDAATVVAMSAGGSPRDVQLMLELGAHDFIPKGPELRGRVTRIVQMLLRA